MLIYKAPMLPLAPPPGPWAPPLRHSEPSEESNDVLSNGGASRVQVYGS